MTAGIKGYINEDGWAHCPSCGHKTKTKIRPDTLLKNFPLFCFICKNENVIDIENQILKLSQEPDVQTQSR